ncbi:MAG: c-type cytochrome [Rhodocyclaceae bacterium]|nr:c-type cytochrome [Rhodocyclaceae bacterium]
MKLIAASIIAAAALAAIPALADDSPGLALAKKSNCMACHAVDKKIVGPAYHDVAKKYAGQKDAEAKLVAKVKAGGKGVWGEIPMPPNSPAVKDEDIKTLVKWVLAGAK